MTKYTLTLKLNFSDPQTISIYSEKDSLVIKFNKGVHILSSQDAFEK